METLKIHVQEIIQIGEVEFKDIHTVFDILSHVGRLVQRPIQGIIGLPRPPTFDNNIINKLCALSLA